MCLLQYNAFQIVRVHCSFPYLVTRVRLTVKGFAADGIMITSDLTVTVSNCGLVGSLLIVALLEQSRLEKKRARSQPIVVVPEDTSHVRIRDVEMAVNSLKADL